MKNLATSSSQSLPGKQKNLNTVEGTQLESLNAITSFSPQNVPGLVLWTDPSDTNTVTTTAASITQGSDFSHADWTKTEVTVNANATIAPDGTMTADEVEQATASAGSVSQLISNCQVGATMIPLTYTFYAKYVDVRWVALRSDANVPDTTNTTFFDIQNGVVGTVGTSMWSITPSITAIGNGWYKCVVTRIASSAAGWFVIYLSTANGTITVPATGTSAYLWGASVNQLRVSALLNKVSQVAVSQATAFNQPGYALAAGNGYVYENSTLKRVGLIARGAVHGLTTTEAAALATFKDSNTQTIFYVVSVSSVGGAAAIVNGDISSSTQPYRLFGRNSTSDLFEARPDVGADVLVNGTAGTWNVNTNYIKEATYDGSNIAQWSNGFATTVSQAGATSTSTPTKISICGWGSFTSSGLTGWLGEVLIYNRVLTASERSEVRRYLSRKWGITVV